MIDVKVPVSEVHLIDCMEYMKTIPDKFFELAIVDPPYGINIGKNGKVGGDKPFGSGKIKHGVGLGIIDAKVYKAFDDSKIPDNEYFEELFRVSHNQIIWGGNYFIENLRNTPSIIVWDKDKSGFFADGEIAWTSFKSSLKIFKYRWNGMLQENMKDKEERMHPTQKPVSLYKWLLTNYAKPGDKIFDSHAGSQSSRLASYDLGFDYYACELDPDYFRDGCKRFEDHKKQLKLF